VKITRGLLLPVGPVVNNENLIIFVFHGRIWNGDFQNKKQSYYQVGLFLFLEISFVSLWDFRVSRGEYEVYSLPGCSAV
jgi:hypothetical protein